MLIVPLGFKPDWRRPPVVTLLLVLVNCWVFFGLQGGDHEKIEQALTYYVESDLPEMEFPRYRQFLDENGKQKDSRAFARLEKEAPPFSAIVTLQNDAAFARALAGGKVFAAGEDGFEAWRVRRDEFERRWRSQITERYAFRVDSPRWYQAVSHMFLHGSVGHLFGNMLILLLVGYIVERVLGALRYLIFYLVGGVGALGLFWFGQTSGGGGLVGASGAISAVMGMYAVLFGLRRIEFFYSILFYFDIARAPAITLLLFWIVNELYQWWTLPYSNVAYLAHVGGLISGAVLVFCFGGKARHSVLAALEAEAPQNDDGRQAAFERAEVWLKKLDFDRARQAWGELAQRYGDDLQALVRYYSLSKSEPGSDDYHRAAALIFALTASDPASIALQAETYDEYARIARPIRLSARRLFMLADRFARHGRPREAAQASRVLLRAAPDEVRLAALLLRVSKAFRIDGDLTQAQVWAEELQQHFPQSAEASLLRDALRAS